MDECLDNVKYKYIKNIWNNGVSERFYLCQRNFLNQKYLFMVGYVLSIWQTKRFVGQILCRIYFFDSILDRCEVSEIFWLGFFTHCFWKLEKNHKFQGSESLKSIYVVTVVILKDSHWRRTLERREIDWTRTGQGWIGKI